MATVLEGFLVRLGFDIDKDGLAKFKNAVAVGTGAFKLLSKTAVGVGAAVAGGMLQAANSLTKMRNAADNANTSITNLRSLQGTFKQLGGSAEQASGMVGSLATMLKETPEMLESLLDSVGVSMRDTNGNIKDTVEIIRDLHNAFKGMNEQEARFTAKNFGIDTASFDILMKPDFLATLQKQHDLTEKTSKGMEAQAEAARNTMNSIGNILSALKNSGQSVFYQALGLAPVEKWTKTFENWLTNELPAAINGAFSLLGKWLDPNDPASPLKLFSEWWDRRAGRTTKREIGIGSKELAALTAEQYEAWQNENEEYKGLSQSEAVRQIAAIEKLAETKEGGQIDTAKKQFKSDREQVKSLTNSSLTTIPAGSMTAHDLMRGIVRTETGGVGHRGKNGKLTLGRYSNGEAPSDELQQSWGRAQVSAGTAFDMGVEMGLISREDARRARNNKKLKAALGRALLENESQNVAIGERYLNKQLQRFGGDIDKAIVAYNQGAGGVYKAERLAREKGGDWRDHLTATAADYLAKTQKNLGYFDGSAWGGVDAKKGGAVAVADNSAARAVQMTQVINVNGAYSPEITADRVMEATNRALNMGYS